MPSISHFSLTKAAASSRGAKPPSGMALVIVLGFLVLISALIIAFFGSVQTDLQNSKSYEASNTVKQLIVTATNIVTGQIADATKSVKDPKATTLNPGDHLDWASQPGMIRTWDDNGNGWKVFKLYSSPDMVPDSKQDGTYPVSNFTADVPSGWSKEPAMYVDLNEPELVDDPAGTIIRNGRNMRASYPILDPLALKEIDGFSITNPPDYAGPTGGNGQPTVKSSDDPEKTGNAAPMPVAWMYVLKDGTLTCPPGSTDNGRTAKWSGAGPTVTPSQTNPIVGRIAFWTDDESCKLNVNTASEPTPWDTPRAVSLQDTNYGAYQPANHEYQRYPGHPFMTALSPVLVPTVLNPTLTQLSPAQKDLIYGLIPRVQKGGSNEGKTSVIGSGPQGITPDQDRLFANVDEFLFEPGFSGQRASITDDSALAPLGLNQTKLKRMRFFLTANSRAPELNLFGGPRICLWPENSNTSQRTAYDNLAAFCTTLGNQPYYFQRANANSQNADYSGIARNISLYQYLQSLTSANIPGFGGNLYTKWGGAAGDRDQILTEMFDYIRCTNLNDTQTNATPFASNGQVTPIVIGNTQGFGRIHTISQFGVHFICTADGPSGSPLDANGKNSPLPSGQRRVQAAFLFEPFCVSLGFYALLENISYQISLSPFSVDGQDLQFPNSTISVSSNNQFASTFHGRNWGGAQGIRAPITAFGGGSYPLIGKRTVVDSSSKKTMQFSGGTATVTVLANGNPIQTFTVKFPSAVVPIPDLVQTGTTTYRGASATSASQWWDMSSRYAMAGGMPLQPASDAYPDARRCFGNDLNNNNPGFKSGCVFRKEDVVRSMVPDNGDIRLVAAQGNPSTGAASKVNWVPCANWNTAAAASVHFVHIFSDPVGTHALYGFVNEPQSTALGYGTSPFGSQLTPANYYFSRLPEINPGAGKAFNKWNDFDNGVAHLIDGAYINKPDEGNIASSGQADTSKYAYFAWNYTAPTPIFFSPNRLVPSAGMFGSLPTGVKRNLPWQTLLFRPDVTKTHPGLGTSKTGQLGGGPPYLLPPDHLVMDLFWMPVVEPYAISEPFSTAGKVNMNYQIAPFTYIRRATAMYGAFKSEQPLVIPNALSRVYKLWDHETSDWPWLPNDPDPRACTDPQVAKDFTSAITGTNAGKTMRLLIDNEQTLQQFDSKFAGGDLYRAASQICDVHLVRSGENLSQYTDSKNTFWNGAYVTGDNTRERPYTNLYAKLTTRSNTFTVHIRAQVLHQIGGPNATDWTLWHEGRDQILSEYRGSNIVERYIDPKDPNLGDFAQRTFASNPALTADWAYRFRIVGSKKFGP